MGLTQARILATSAAPMRKEVVEYFMGLNMPLQDLIGKPLQCIVELTLLLVGVHVQYMYMYNSRVYQLFRL